VIVYAVVDDALSPDFPLGVELEVFACPRKTGYAVPTAWRQSRPSQPSVRLVRPAP
jgi:hypothetical protein